jgi:deoxyribodipyrimidine photolyase
MYKVFTPFKNAFLRRLREALPECVAAPTVRARPLTPAPLPEIRYPQEAFDPHLFADDEKTAIARLRRFCQQKAADYDLQRDFPPRKAPAGCRHVWPWAYFPRASACIDCWLSSPRRSTVKQAPSG